MKTLLLLLISIGCCLGQGVKEIVVESQRTNEPPMIPGPPLYRISFKRGKSGDFVASVLQEHSGRIKRTKLKEAIVLSKQQVDQTFSWISTNQSSFRLSELDIGYQLINKELSAFSLDLTEKINPDLVVKTDSFRLCKSLDGRRIHGTGRTTLRVFLRLESGDTKSFTVRSIDFKDQEFNLQEYLMLYPLLKDKLAIAHTFPDFFNESQLAKILRDYLEIVECEGFYYKEFVSLQPQRTPMDNRMKKGWDFKEYMKNRKE
jgi:hypothetical protein